MINPLRPYVSLIGAGLGLALLAGSGWVGWQLRAAAAEKAQGHLERKVISLESSLNDMLDLYEEVDAEAKAAAERADRWRIRADDEVKLAADRKARTAVRLQDMEAELMAAKDSPSCRAQLEATLCAPIY